LAYTVGNFVHAYVVNRLSKNMTVSRGLWVGMLTMRRVKLNFSVVSFPAYFRRKRLGGLDKHNCLVDNMDEGGRILYQCINVTPFLIDVLLLIVDKSMAGYMWLWHS